jgi:integrase/recombinase XerD
MDLTDLLASWTVSLRAERKSPETIRSYTHGVRQFIATGRPLDRANVSAWTADLLDTLEPTTARARQLAVRRFSAWLTDEAEQPTDPLLGLHAPRLDSKVVQPLSDDDLRALLVACRGPGLVARRDEALVRFMLETGCRAGEAVGMSVGDVDLVAGVALIRRGKGGRGRTVPFGPVTARALDRYMRARRPHPRAGGPALWLGGHGHGLSYGGLHKALGLRAAAAGLVGFHPHRLRHTAAHRWLAAGGSEGGLMTVAGWSDPNMLARYTRAWASNRAADEARRLNLGDL